MKKMFAVMDKGILCSADMKQPKYKILYACLCAIMIIYCLIVFVPCLWLMLSGFKDVGELYQRPVKFFPKQINFKKFTDTWVNLKFYKYYLNTIIMAGGCVICDVAINGLAGYVLSRLKPKGSKAISVLVFSLMLLPSTMSTVPLYMTFKDFPYAHINMLESYVPIWLIAGANAFNIMLFKSSFDGISNSLVEAAKLDGASNIKIFFNVIVPLSVPVIITVSLFTFNGQFGNFFWPYLLITEKEKTVLGVQIYNMKRSTLTMDYQMLCILFSIIPQLLVFTFFQKYIIGGINLGGVKG